MCAYDQDGNTALVCAVNEGSVECVRALLTADGIDVNVQNKVLGRAGSAATCVPLVAAHAEGCMLTGHVSHVRTIRAVTRRS